ncbi:succinate dehydrogenase, cytochrome b556 subunit [Dyella monticola]|uniref:Succinate dehydrogenase cytochrome b556 subunit n=1 Tax=Dyella monticola TaxID=1927958 RepID=A0A370WWM6_9GAMM|nr:succinate dehydrogenase, cytochrome b556 subunit [Dyella monticola]RDS80553.1 succinate dehydrogenase, cytochrome b556 subunit [Dyella monticola]
MAQTQRPLSPHLQIYKWQVQMVTSILHRATGIALAVGTLIVVWGLVALAAGEDAFNQFKVCAGSPIGIILLIGWTWSFFFHLCNGVRHLVQDAGAGYTIVQFVRSSWASVIVSLLLTLIVWGYVLSAGGAA